MTGSETLLARITLGAVASIASVSLAASSRLLSLPSRRFDRLLFTAFVLSRVGLFILVFLILRIAPRGDVQAYYFDQATKVLDGLMPYRDFISSYAPLHAYLDAGLISIWHTPLAIMFFSVLFELLLLPLWMKAGREFLSETDLRITSLLYIASPISLQFVTIDGQDNVVIAVLAALAMLLVLRSRSIASGAAFAASIAAIKFLPLLYAPAFFLAAPRRWRFFLGAVVILSAVYGGFALLHAPILEPIAAEGDLRSAGNIPYVVEALFGVQLPSRLVDGILLLVLIAILGCVGRAAHRAPVAARMRALTTGMAALTLALLVFSKKSWPPYLMLALFPVCVVASRRGSTWRTLKIALFSTFSVVAVAEHSYWSSSFRQISSADFHRPLVAHQSSAYGLLAIELLLVVGYLWLLYEATCQLLDKPGLAVPLTDGA